MLTSGLYEVEILDLIPPNKDTGATKDRLASFIEQEFADSGSTSIASTRNKSCSSGYPAA
jgi:hypothetical protein